MRAHDLGPLPSWWFEATPLGIASWNIAYCQSIHLSRPSATDRRRHTDTRPRHDIPTNNPPQPASR